MIDKNYNKLYWFQDKRTWQYILPLSLNTCTDRANQYLLNVGLKTECQKQLYEGKCLAHVNVLKWLIGYFVGTRGRMEFWKHLK